MAEEAPYAHPKRVVLQTRVERWRAKLQKDSRLRRLYDRAALPVDEPTEFRVDAHTLASQLMPKDGDPAARAARAADILQEAQGIFQQAEDRAAGATDRATTLQEAVGIAATLLIAGAGLIVGQSALQGLGWVIAFALLLLGATVTLVMSGLRALAAASTIHVWYRPTAGDIVKRSQLPEAVARTRLAAETLIDYGYNTKVAGWKVAHLNASAWWYRIALAFIVSIAMLVGIYALFGTNHGSKPTPASQAHASVFGSTLGAPVRQRLPHRSDGDRGPLRGSWRSGRRLRRCTSGQCLCSRFSARSALHVRRSSPWSVDHHHPVHRPQRLEESDHHAYRGGLAKPAESPNLLRLSLMRLERLPSRRRTHGASELTRPPSAFPTDPASPHPDHDRPVLADAGVVAKALTELVIFDGAPDGRTEHRLQLRRLRGRLRLRASPEEFDVLAMGGLRARRVHPLAEVLTDTGNAQFFCKQWDARHELPSDLAAARADEAFEREDHPRQHDVHVVLPGEMLSSPQCPAESPRQATADASPSIQ